jgi:hypothetical protein
MGVLMSIHTEEVAALLVEDFDSIAVFKTKLKVARDHKSELVELYRQHVASHGC